MEGSQSSPPGKPICCGALKIGVGGTAITDKGSTSVASNDVTKARTELNWEPRHSNAAMVIESYEWFLAHRHELESANRSHHQSPVRPGLLRVLKRLP